MWAKLQRLTELKFFTMFEGFMNKPGLRSWHKWIKPFLKEGNFAHDFAVTLSGNALSVIIGFLFTPFIARVYGPEAYGSFALFMAVAGLISILITFQFPAGYVTIAEQSEFYLIVKITLVIVIIFSGLSYLIIIWAGDQLIEYFSWHLMKKEIILLPGYLLLMGFDQIIHGWNIRLKQFKKAAAGKLLSTIFSKTVTILLGRWLGPYSFGLIIGNWLMYPVEGILRFGAAMRNEFKDMLAVPLQNASRLLIKYKAYPLYVTSGAVVSNLTVQLPVYFISYWLDPVATGLFAMANSLVSVPMNVVIASSSAVFLQKSAEMHIENPTGVSALAEKLYVRLFFFGFAGLIILALLSEIIFTLLLGQQWKPSGTYAIFLALSFIPAVPAQPLSVLFRILNKEQTNFYLQIFFIMLKGLALWIGAQSGNMLHLVIYYTLASFFCYEIYLFAIGWIARLNLQRLLVHMILTLLVILIFLVIKL